MEPIKGEVEGMVQIIAWIQIALRSGSIEGNPKE